MSVTVSRTPAGAGEAFTRATLQRMAMEVNRTLLVPQLVERAVDIVQGVDGRDTLGQYHALRDWLEGHVSFMPDPLVNGDVLRAPDYVLGQIERTGAARIDCDDCAMLSAALGKAIGLPARFRVLGFPRWAHVYTELLTKDGWLPLDVTEDAARRRWAAEQLRQGKARAATFVV